MARARVATTAEEETAIREVVRQVNECATQHKNRVTIATRCGRRLTGVLFSPFACIDDGNVHGATAIIDDRGEPHGVDYSDVLEVCPPETPRPFAMDELVAKNFGRCRPMLIDLMGFTPAPPRFPKIEAAV